MTWRELVSAVCATLAATSAVQHSPVYNPVGVDVSPSFVYRPICQLIYVLGSVAS